MRKTGAKSRAQRVARTARDEKALARAARADAPSCWEAQSKVRALGALLELDACHPLGKRRRWYCNLAEDGRLEDAQEQRCAARPSPSAIQGG